MAERLGAIYTTLVSKNQNILFLDESRAIRQSQARIVEAVIETTIRMAGDKFKPLPWKSIKLISFSLPIFLTARA